MAKTNHLPELESRIIEAVAIGGKYGAIDGGHHKTWVIDQMIRTLLGDEYQEWLEAWNGHGSEWDEGIAP